MALYYDLPVFKDVYNRILKIYDYTREFPKEYKYTPGCSGNTSILIGVIFLFLPMKNQAQSNYVTEYFPNIYAAELSIIDGNYNNALNSYQSAFNSVHNLFAIDLVNATVCASKLDSIDLAFKYLTMLVRKSISKSYLLEFDGFKSLRLTQEWASFFLTVDSVKNNVHFNIRYKSVLDSISRADQEFRVAPESYTLFRDTIAYIDSSNIALLRFLINKNGFPNEHILGREFPGIGFPSSIVLVHHCQSLSKKEKTSKHNFHSEFYNAVQNGEFDPHQMARLISLQGDHAPRLGQNTLIQLSTSGNTSKLLKEILNSNQIPEIDAIRLKAGLENQDDFIKKAQFEIENPRRKEFAFSRYNSIDIYEVDKVTYERLIKYFEPIKN